MIKDNYYIETEGIIYKLAHKYKNVCNFDDLVQAGYIGVIKAINNYKDNNDTKFSTYAYKYILGEMIDFIRKDKNIIISEEAYSIYKKYLKVKELLLIKLEREASFDEICNYLEIEKENLLLIIESVGFTKSLDDSFDNIYSDKRDDIDNELLIKNELENLDLIDRTLIKIRYFDGYSQSETAQIMGLSQSKVSRKENLILKKIKDNITN